MKKLFYQESGEGVLSGMYTMFVIAVVLFLAVEIAGYGTSAWKLYGAAGEIMEWMKSENGLDTNMERRFRELKDALGLRDMATQIRGTPKTMQRGELLELRVDASYRVHCLRPFGRELSVPIRLRLHGLAHTYIRAY